MLVWNQECGKLHWVSPASPLLPNCSDSSFLTLWLLVVFFAAEQIATTALVWLSSAGLEVMWKLPHGAFPPGVGLFVGLLPAAPGHQLCWKSHFRWRVKGNPCFQTQLKNTCWKCSVLLLTCLKAGGMQELFPYIGSNREIDLWDRAHGFARKIRVFFFSLLRSQCCPEKRGFSSVKTSSLAPLWFCCRF